MNINITRSVKEFHLILPLEQLPAAFKQGIAPNLYYIPNNTVEKKVMKFVALFFNGKNTALKRMIERKEELCVLRINSRVMNLPYTWIADREATVEGAIFFQGQQGLEKLNFSLLFSKKGWTDRKASLAENRNRAQQRCAQLLVPNGLNAQCITGIYVVSQKVKVAIQSMSGGSCPVPIIVKTDFFFEKMDPNPVKESGAMAWESIDSDCRDLALLSSSSQRGKRRLSLSMDLSVEKKPAKFTKFTPNVTTLLTGCCKNTHLTLCPFSFGKRAQH